MKSCGSGGTLWVLLEVPPHGGGGGPRMAAGVAEWCGRDAGRRSAGLGSKGGTQAHTHAVGVRARVWLPRVTRICAKAVPGGNLRK